MSYVEYMVIHSAMTIDDTLKKKATIPNLNRKYIKYAYEVTKLTDGSASVCVAIGSMGLIQPI